MKRKYVFLLIASISIILIGAIIVIVIHNISPKVRDFNVDDYQYYIENFSSDENVGSIVNAKDVAKKAESIWVKIYGTSIKKEKPYQILYDEKANVWLVRGTLKSHMKGGVANILIENDTGKVLAVWHDK